MKKTFILFCNMLIFMLLGNVALAQSCNDFHVTATPNSTILYGESVNLQASGLNFSHWTADPAYDFGGQENNASITVFPTQNTMFTAHSFYETNPELVYNGGFESGNTGFSSWYTTPLEQDPMNIITDQRYYRI